MSATDTAPTNGHSSSTTNGKHEPASFLVEKMLAATAHIGDGTPATPGAAPNNGRFPLPHVLTFSSIIGAVSKVYRANDEAIRNSVDNARFMRNDCGVMECVEARQRAVSLLGWHIEPEDKKSARQKGLCTELTKILSRIPRFDMYRYVLANAAWYGRYAVQNQYNWVNVGGKHYCFPHPEHGDHEGLGWLPINGDKIVFRYDDGTLDPERPAGQVGIRVGAFSPGQTIGGRWKVEATDRGMAYFLAPDERRNIAIHKHAIEDGAYEAAVDAGMIHGVGIRSRIYWDWFQKQECLAFLMEYLQRSAGGIELWYYDEGNPKAKAETEQAATNRVSNGGRNIILVPRPRGEDAMAYGVQLVEPGVQGVAELKDLLTNYFGHRIKRYILGQTLTSEADATGLGSGVAAAHIDTFMQIVKFDANGIDETLTRQLLRQIQLYNFPDSVGVWLKFKTETESPDVDKKLSACSEAFQMGARFKEEDILNMVGMEAPGPDDRALQSPAFQQQPGMEGAPGAMPGAGGGGVPGTAGAGGDGASLMAGSLHPTTVAVAMRASEETKRALFGGGKTPQTSNPAADTGERVKETEQYSKSADEAAAETDCNPSDEQKASGNFRKGKFRVHGLTITIETPKGAERRGKNREGQEWSVTMPVHYGYINRTEGKDGDYVDVFVGPNPESEIVFVVDQTTNGGRFDEHKVMLGFTKQSDARDAYLASYSDDAIGRIRDLTPMTVSQLRAWLEEGDLSQPVSNQVSRYARPGSVAHYDRPASIEELPADIGKPSTKKGGKGGSWVRLGGGAPAFVGPDGTIKKGCPGLKGENVDDLIDEEDESRDRRAAKQAHAESKGLKGHEVTATETKKWEGQGAQRQHDAAKAAAKRHGVNVADVIQGLPAAHEQRLAQWTQVETARQRARKLAGMNAGDLGRAENKYLDHSAVGGFDDIAASFVSEHPEMGFGRSGDAAAEVWDFIREGAQPKPMIHDDETADMAAGMVGKRGEQSEPSAADEADEWSGGGDGSWETSDDSFDPAKFSKRNAPKPYSWNRT